MTKPFPCDDLVAKLKPGAVAGVSEVSLYGFSLMRISGLIPSTDFGHVWHSSKLQFAFGDDLISV